MPFQDMLVPVYINIHQYKFLSRSDPPASPDCLHNMRTETLRGTCRTSGQRSARWRGRSCSTAPRSRSSPFPHRVPCRRRCSGCRRSCLNFAGQPGVRPMAYTAGAGMPCRLCPSPSLHCQGGRRVASRWCGKHSNGPEVCGSYNSPTMWSLVQSSCKNVAAKVQIN